ncbi:MAG TPA: YtxH domain-containing protein [Bacteroidota bacterium]
MATENDGMAKGLIVGFIAGSVVGAVLALLYAPKSGRELRRDIKEKSSEFLGNAEDYLANARHKADDILNDGKRRSESVITDARKRAETLMGDAERIIADARGKTRGESPKS